MILLHSCIYPLSFSLIRATCIVPLRPVGVQTYGQEIETVRGRSTRDREGGRPTLEKKKKKKPICTHRQNNIYKCVIIHCIENWPAKGGSRQNSINFNEIFFFCLIF